MQSEKVSPWYKINSSSLVLLTFATVFFPRVVAAMGVPPVINFVHFIFVIMLCAFTLSKIKTKIGSQISKEFLFGLLLLLGLILTSAIVNHAGVINVILDFLLLSEPFLLILAIVSIRVSQASVKKFRFWIMLFAFIHMGFIFYQVYVMGLGADPDDIKGVFIGQGFGHHMGGGIVLTAAVYFLLIFKTIPIWVRLFVALLFFHAMALSDSKQVVVCFLVSFVILLFTKVKKFGVFFQYISITIVASVLALWSASFVFPGSEYWLNVDLLIRSYEAKYSVFPIIFSYEHSPFNWLFGLGPGHTIGRLGWLIPDYIQYLQPLGVTTSPVTEAVFLENDTNPLTCAATGSSMFSLTFTWAGIWGDLGFLGLGAYLYLGFLIWRRLCLDDLSKFFLLNMLIFGAIFSWMEEPSYMLFMTSLICTQWQAFQMKQQVTSTSLFKGNSPPTIESIHVAATRGSKGRYLPN